jgi:hypothetical protein
MAQDNSTRNRKPTVLGLRRVRGQILDLQRKLKRMEAEYEAAHPGGLEKIQERQKQHRLKRADENRRIRQFVLKHRRLAAKLSSLHAPKGFRYIRSYPWCESEDQVMNVNRCYSNQHVCVAVPGHYADERAAELPQSRRWIPGEGVEPNPVFVPKGFMFFVGPATPR